MAFDLVHIWASMGLFAKLIAGFLLLMAIASVGVVVERLTALSRSAKESRRFANEAAPVIDAWRIEELIEAAARYKHGALPKLLGGITQRYLRGWEISQGLTPVEMARSDAERRKEALGAELRKGMSVLATVGSVAPFIGLLGTVIGIISAFQGIASTGSGGLGSVSAGIAEALVETALGLMVAIFAVLCFNYLTGRINEVEMALARSAGELLDEMENRDGRKPEQRIRTAA
jgi:biopolymer transport protein ExbB